jgi:hypothetical protein
MIYLQSNRLIMKFIKASILLLIIGLSAARTFAQTTREKSIADSLTLNVVNTHKDSLLKNTPSPIPLTPEEKQKLAKRYIPSIIANTGMAPAKFDNIGFTFGDDKFSFSKGLSNHFGLKLGADAPNQSLTIFKPGQSAYSFTSELKGTAFLPGAKWELLDKGGNPTGEISSTREDWINFTGNLSYQSLPLFTTDSTYSKNKEVTFEFMVSINSVFNSLFIKRHMAKRYLFSFGLGIGKINNYKKLDELTYRPGNYYNSKTAFVENDDPVIGRKGEFKSFVGSIIRLSVFKPLLSPFSLTNLSLGFTGSSAGAFSNNHMLNANGGLYFSKRHWEVDTDEPSTLDCPDNTAKNCKIKTPKKLIEDFSVGLILDWKNLQDSHIAGYSNKNFKVLLSAQIPLRFDK